MDLTPMTELDAVNMMLISIGQTPVNTLSVTGIRDVAIAQTILQNTSRSVQNKGWSFNKETDYEMVPDGSDNIVVPTQAFFVDPVDVTNNYVIRDNAGTLMLYDLDEKTFTITDNPLCVNIVWFYDFAEIPQHARNYIAVRAARTFQAFMVGSQILYAFTKDEEIDALVVMKKIDMRSKDTNILRDGDYTNAIFHRRFLP